MPRGALVMLVPRQGSLSIIGLCSNAVALSVLLSCAGQILELLKSTRPIICFSASQETSASMRSPAYLSGQQSHLMSVSTDSDKL